MLKVFLVVLGLCAIAQAAKSKSKDSTDATCMIDKRGRLETFSGTTERINIPCKYNAISGTMCGKYKVWLNPGNELDHKGRLYQPSGLWLRVQKISDDNDTLPLFSGWATFNTTMTYIQNKTTIEHPFVLRKTSASYSDYFRKPKIDGKKVTITAKGGFSLAFSLYDREVKDSYKNPFFSFTCTSRFEPIGYPREICGNGTEKEIRTYTREMGYGKPDTTMILNIFTSKAIGQFDAECKAATIIMSTKCKDKELEAAQACGPIFTDSTTRKCLAKGDYDIKAAFRRCVTYICSGGKNKNSCQFLADATEKCNKLKAATVPNGCDGEEIKEE